MAALCQDTSGATLTGPGLFGVDGVAFSPDGKKVAIADGDGSIYVWGVR
ncbi:MAG TPA: WD40 repeat domain-containing protein [Streptosporangiaceae bacterium]|nr:WD40 repeat domain-containing protein [Streptosporangiaceae bacterium]